jgi:RNA polymerase sigma-70 factor, ECF subfamily
MILTRKLFPGSQLFGRGIPRVVCKGVRRKGSSMLSSPRPAAAGPRVLDPATLAGHVDRLMRAALAMTGSRADAEDLVQEACLRVLAKPRMVRGSELAYLHGVLRNTFISDYQMRVRRRTTPVEPEGFAHVPARASDGPEVQAIHGELKQAIADLPDHYRDAVVAVDVLGLPYAEAADVLGVATGTIMSRLYRGRSAVADRVGVPELLAA